MKITKEWLKQKQACPKGYRWFVRTYPDGLMITKKNIQELVHKLFNKNY